MIRLGLSSMLILSVAGPLSAQRVQTPETFQLTVFAQAPAAPQLKDELLPDSAAQTTGNAATVYLTAFATAGRTVVDKSLNEDALESASPAELDEARAQKYADAFRTSIQECEIAGMRSDCQWDSTIREQGFDALLPYLNEARMVANALSIRAKLQIKQRRYDEAVRTIRIGLTMSRDLTREPILVQELVATGIESVMLQDVRYLSQQKGAPNLYWPLASLTTPAEKRVQMMQLERAALFFTYPGLRHPEQLSAQESRRIIYGIEQQTRTTQDNHEIETALSMIGAYPKAKAYLVEQGMSPAQVDDLPANTVVLTWYVREYQRRNEAMDKWVALPLWEAFRGVAREISAWDSSDNHDNPLLKVVPAYNRVILQFALIEREKAILQTINAIRAYAAAHDNVLPKSLSDLTPETPAPLDAVFGKPFDYRVQGQTATLIAPIPPGGPQFQEKIYTINLGQ